MSKDALEDWDETAANNTDIGGTSLVDSVATVDTLDTIFNKIMSQVAKHLGSDTLASATTADLSTVPGRYVNITGTTTITGLGTETAGCIKFLYFSDALTFTHNGTSLILPTGANITTAAGDVAVVASEGSGNWRCLGYMRADGSALSSGTLNQLFINEAAAAASDVAGDGQIWVLNTSPDSTNAPWFTDDAGNDHAVVLAGKHSIYIPAGAMVAAATSGAASGSVEETTNAHNYATLDFDASSDEYACFEILMPSDWNESTLTFQVSWSSTATDTGGVSWGLQAVAVADGDNSDVAYGSAVVVDDANQSSAGDVLITAESGAVTVAGSPAAGELTQFRIFRDVSDANDTATEDAMLRGVRIFYTTNEGWEA